MVDRTGRAISRSGQATRPGEFTRMAYNFCLFFGLAVQAYKATLVSDDTDLQR